jgi:regulator of protease activity HflC (stomatin/prohibitin superfamily)
MMKKLVITLLAATALAGCSRIDTGNTGVEATFGQVKEQTLPPGVYFSLFKTIHEVNTMEYGLEISDMSPKARDNVTLTDVDLTVYFRVDPRNVSKIMTRYAGDMKWNSKTGSYIVGHDLVARMAREAIYNAFTKYNASEMHLRRAELAAAIRENLQIETDADAGKGMFEITNVLVRNIVTDPRLEEAIKQSAEVEFAVRQRQQQQELARVEAERKRIEAEGEAAANRIIAESITPALIELRRIEAMSNFAKQGTHTVILPQNTTPLIQVK